MSELSADPVRTTGLVLAAIVVLASGVWLTRTGKPYGAVVLNVHKLVDLGAVVIIGIAVFQANKVAPLSALEWIVIAATALLVIATFSTGGAISAMQAPPDTTLWLHRIGSWVSVAFAAATVYLLGS